MIRLIAELLAILIIADDVEGFYDCAYEIEQILELSL
jgi:hypothetical protein